MLNRADLHNSYRIFFPDKKIISTEAIRNLNIESIRSVYRRLVLNNHPDRARILGYTEKALTENLININRAYENLTSYINSNKIDLTNIYYRKSSPNRNENRDYGPATYSTRSSSAYMPKKKLFFGQYLVFSGAVKFSSLISAIHWQRSQRDSFGKIALQWKILNIENIIHILKNKAAEERFGECALRLGYINNFQLIAILSKQRNVHKPLGQYFIINKILDEKSIETFSRLHKIHNQKYAKAQGSI